MMTSGSEARNWMELPRELTASILSRLGAIEILNNAQRVCPQWRNICKDPYMWRSIDMLPGDLHTLDFDFEKMCAHAVDLSRGDLLHINIEYFGTDNLLSYIADSARHLRSLRLVLCYDLSDEGLIKAVPKLPLLEELEISLCTVTKDALEAIGRCCPLLKSFKFNIQSFRHPSFENDEEALAIAENMHALQHLQLFGNKLTNDGLQAILDGCPYLESLDLRHCFNVNLGGDLEKRCVERIKDLRRPRDSTDDYRFNARLYDDLISDEDYLSGPSDLSYDYDYDDDDMYDYDIFDYDDDYGRFLFG